MRRTIVLGSLLALTACEGARPRASGNPRGNGFADAQVAVDAQAGDTGAGLDAGTSDAAALDGATPGDAAPMDAGAPADAGPPADGGTASGPCPPHSALDRVGRRWVVRSNAAYEAQNGFQWTQTSELVSLVDQGGHHEAQVDATQVVTGMLSTGGSYMAQTTSSIRYRCDAQGLSLISQVLDTNANVDGNVTRTTATITYAPALLMQPPTLQVGQSWSARSVQTTMSVSNGQPNTTSTEVSPTSTVLGVESVTVPAGTFENAWRVRTDWGSTAVVGHWVDDVGMVADDNSELVSY